MTQASEPMRRVRRPGITVTPSRSAAAGILSDIRDGQLLDISFERRTAALDARDRRWIQQLVWGVLRNRGYIDAVLMERTRGGLGALDEGVLDILRLGVWQLISMGSVPPHAAIGQSVEAVKRRHGIGASKLTNAVLRRIDRERSHLDPVLPDDPNEALSIQFSHPEWLVSRWVQRWGPEEACKLLAINNSSAPVIVRPHGVTSEELAGSLHESGVRTRGVALMRGSLELIGTVALTETDAFKRGQFYVQDPAATLVAQYAHVPYESVVADLCAAPGGKALELSRRARFVVAADSNPARVARMRSGFARLVPALSRGGGAHTCAPWHASGAGPRVSRIAMLVADATRPAISPVDCVLIDVPCTGTGTFRRHPDARWRIRISDLAVMRSLQSRILEGAATLVRPGGLLVYSTCSLEPEENDEPVNTFLASHPEYSLEPPPDGVVPEEVLDRSFLRVLPQRHGVDGSFAARLRRAAT